MSHYGGPELHGCQAGLPSAGVLIEEEAGRPQDEVSHSILFVLFFYIL